MDSKATLENYMAFYQVTLANPKVLVGVFLGVWGWERVEVI